MNDNNDLNPRYRIVTATSSALSATVADLQRSLRPGDRIVSVWPAEGNGAGLNVLIELRHPSWAAERVGWGAST